MENVRELNVQQKFLEVRKTIDSFVKDATSGNNPKFSYSYVSGSQILSKIKAKMDEVGLLLMPKIHNQEFEKHNYKNKSGQEKIDFVVHGGMSYQWINADKPEEVMEFPWYYTGQQDDISKAFGSALTYSERYYLLKTFGIQTDDEDPDRKNKGDQQPQSNGYSNNNYQGNNQGSTKALKLITEKQQKKIEATLSKMVSGDKTIPVLMAGLKKRLNTDKPIKEWTMSQASQAIDILEPKKQNPDDGNFYGDPS